MHYFFYVTFDYLILISCYIYCYICWFTK